MRYAYLICATALFGLVLGFEEVDFDFFVNTNHCDNTPQPDHFVSEGCFQNDGPTALRINTVNGNSASGNPTGITCQTFTSQDCSGAALQPIIDGTVQNDVNWGTQLGQCAGFIESMGSFHCQGSGLEKRGNLTSDNTLFTKVDMVVTGGQTLLAGITNIVGQCPDHKGACAQGALQTLVGSVLGAVGAAQLIFSFWKRSDDERVHFNTTSSPLAQPINRLYHLLPNDTAHKISLHDELGAELQFSYYYNESAQSHHLHAPFAKNDLSRRQTCNGGDFCENGDDGYGGTFFDGDSAVWGSVTSDQVSGFGQKMLEGLESDGSDSACGQINDDNGEIASLWFQPANDATFNQDQNGCPNFTPAKRSPDPPKWAASLAVSSGVNFLGGIPNVIDNCHDGKSNGRACVASVFNTILTGITGLLSSAIHFFAKRDGQSTLASDTVHDISDILGSRSRVLIHRNSTTSEIHLHASFGQPSSGVQTRQCTDNGPFCLSNDDGYVGVFFDKNPNEWAGADEMTPDQVPAVTDKVIDFMQANNDDAACLDFVDSNSGDSAASLWLQPSNGATFNNARNGCPNI